MFAKVMRRRFHAITSDHMKRLNTANPLTANPKFPEGTIAGLLKTSVIENGEKDILRINNQRINWSLKELDKYSSAFAFGLMEAGFVRGDSLVLWVNKASNAECIVSQIGAAKAGVTCVSFDERHSQDALDHALRESGAKGLIFSADASVEGTSNTRADLV
jgi:acyl-CoA synthetase (AMP-forming)/AMP-acid ligase II